MKIRAVVRQRVLTNFVELSTKGKVGLPNYAVQLYCNDRGKVYYITTDMTTTCTDLKDGMFHDKDKSATVNIARSAELHALIERCMDWANENAFMSVELVKEGLQGIVRGDKVRKSHQSVARKGLADYLADLSEEKDNASTKSLYMATSRKVREYGGNIGVDEVTADWLKGWERWLTEGGYSVNGISRYMRDVRHCVYWCIENGWSANHLLFKKYKIKNEVKRMMVLTGQDIADFRDYPCEHWMEEYRDMALLSFYLCGVNTGDLLLCKGLERGRRFVYERQKTGAHGDVWVCDEAWDIIERYRGKEYLLRWMDGRASYKSFGNSADDALKKIGLVEHCEDALGKMRRLVYHPIFKGLTLYTFRRSFASIASNELDIPRETIAQCLTHSWADVTERYIYRDTRKVDGCVRRMAEYIGSLKGRSKEEIDREIMLRDGMV